MSPFHAQMLRNSCFFWEVGGQIAFFPLLGINIHEIKAEKPVRPVPPAGLGALARWVGQLERISSLGRTCPSEALLLSDPLCRSVKSNRYRNASATHRRRRAGHPASTVGFFGQAACLWVRETVKDQKRHYRAKHAITKRALC